MKKYILLAICFCFALSAEAQMSADDQKLLEESMAQEADMMLQMEEELNQYEKNVDVKASHPDGSAALAKHLDRFTSSPAAERANTVEATTVVAVIVDTDGTPILQKVEQSANRKLDQKALSAVAEIQNWTPATKNGQAVRSKLLVPVTFRIPG